MEILLSDFSLSSRFLVMKILGFKKKLIEFYQEFKDTPQFQFIPLLLTPESKGIILLKSNDPKNRPIIIPNYFKERIDIERIIKGIRESIRIKNTKAFEKYNAKLITKPIPGCEEYEYESDDYWECHIRKLPFSMWHYVGTCKMGPKTDPMAVVDHELKVQIECVKFNEDLIDYFLSGTRN